MEFKCIENFKLGKNIILSKIKQNVDKIIKDKSTPAKKSCTGTGSWPMPRSNYYIL